MVPLARMHEVIGRLVDGTKPKGPTALALLAACIASGGSGASWLWIFLSALGLTLESWPRLHDLAALCARCDEQVHHPGSIEETPSLLGALLQATYLANCIYAAGGWLLGHAMGVSLAR
jgi:hypothetical protein